VLALVWALGAWLVAAGTSGVWAVVQAAVTAAGIVALGRLAVRARAVWRGQASTDVFALPMLAAFGLAALWWLTVALASF
jgi:hypothetical protein